MILKVHDLVRERTKDDADANTVGNDETLLQRRLTRALTEPLQHTVSHALGADPSNQLAVPTKDANIETAYTTSSGEKIEAVAKEEGELSDLRGLRDSTESFVRFRASLS